MLHDHVSFVFKLFNEDKWKKQGFHTMSSSETSWSELISEKNKKQTNLAISRVKAAEPQAEWLL